MIVLHDNGPLWPLGAYSHAGMRFRICWAAMARVRPAAILGALGAALVMQAPGPRPPPAHASDPAREILDGQMCHCGCGNPLPGSGEARACFGCSVGLAEVTFVRESLAAGREPAEILVSLSDPVLIEVFADYTDPTLPETWRLAKRVAAELQHHRVVLRSPARSPDARRAVALAECARRAERFTPVQSALIAHSGPWDAPALLELGAAQDLPPEPARACLHEIDVSQQLAKDREHAQDRRIGSLATITVNRRPVPSTDEALREVIRRLVREQSL